MNTLRDMFAGLGWIAAPDPDEEDDETVGSDDISDDEFDRLPNFPPKNGLFAGRR